MTSRSEKARKNELRNAFKAKEKEHFLNSLPAETDLFHELFDHLDQHLVECDNRLTLTREFLKRKGVTDDTAIIHWLTEQGGYCDCEVLGNVEEKFE